MRNGTDLNHPLCFPLDKIPGFTLAAEHQQVKSRAQFETDPSTAVLGEASFTAEQIFAARGKDLHLKLKMGKHPFAAENARACRTATKGIQTTLPLYPSKCLEQWLAHPFLFWLHEEPPPQTQKHAQQVCATHEAVIHQRHHRPAPSHS